MRERFLCTHERVFSSKPAFSFFFSLFFQSLGHQHTRTRHDLNNNNVTHLKIARLLFYRILCICMYVPYIYIFIFLYSFLLFFIYISCTTGAGAVARIDSRPLASFATKGLLFELVGGRACYVFIMFTDVCP